MVERKCTNCKTWNQDVDYCINCNAVISLKEEERIETEIKIEIERNKPKDKIDLFVEKYKNHPNLIVRGIFYIFYSVYLVFAGIGALLAWMTVLSQA